MYLFIVCFYYLCYFLYCYYLYFFLLFILFLLCKRTTRFFSRIEYSIYAESSGNFPSCIGTFQTNTVREWRWCWKSDWWSTNSRNQKGDRSVRGVHRQPLNHVQSAIFTYFFFFSFSYFRWSNELVCPYAITFHYFLRLVSRYIFFIRYNGGLGIFTLRFCDSINPGMKRTCWIYYNLQTF